MGTMVWSDGETLQPDTSKHRYSEYPLYNTPTSCPSSEQSDSPTPREESESPPPREESESPTSREESGSLTLHEESGSLTLHEESGNLTLHEESGSLTLHEESESPPPREVSESPTSREESGSLTLHEESGSLTLHEESGSLTLNEESKSPTSREESESPTSREESGSLTLHEESGSLTLREESGSLTLHEESGSLTLHEESGSLTLHEESKSPTSREESESPTSHEESGSSISYEESGSPTLSESSLSHEQHKSLLSNEQAGTYSRMERDKPQSPFSSEESTREDLPLLVTSEVSAFSTGEGSSHSSGRILEDRRKRPLIDILKEQNEKLHKEQINLVRERIAAKETLERLMTQYEHLKHCNSCLDETHKDLLQSCDFSHNISLGRNNQQSFSSQTCLSNESTKIVSPMINLERSDLSFTSNDGNQSRVNLGSPDERQAVKASDKRRDCYNNQVTRETISEQQIIHHPDSQEKVIATITRFLKSSPRAELPMKRSYASEDVEELCQKYTEHGHELPNSSTLCELNGQLCLREYAFTEEQRVNKQPIQQKANGTCRKSRRIVHPEVCIRPNVEYKNNSCPDEATDETNLIKPVRNIEDELLTERFTALSVSHVENVCPANDVTDKEKDKETRTQSDNEETSEIKDKNEALTGAESATKAEDRSHDDYLLDESMKTLHVSDTNITSDKTKDLSVVDNESKEADWSKDRNASSDKNNITTKKKDYGDKSLLEKIKENLPVNKSLVAQQIKACSTKEDCLGTYYSSMQKLFRRSKKTKKIGPQKPLKTFVPFRDINYNYVPSSDIIYVTLYEIFSTRNRYTYNNISSHIMSVINKVWHNIYKRTKASGFIEKEIYETKIFST